MLAKRKAAGTLSELAGPDGTTHCVFLCCDLPYQYIDEYFQKLGEQQFHPIRNEVNTTSMTCWHVTSAQEIKKANLSTVY